MNSIYIFFCQFFKTTFIFVTTVIFTLSLIFYNSNDNSFFYQNGQNLTNKNLLGNFGANIASLLLYFFGSAIYFYIFVLLSVLFLQIKYNNAQKIYAKKFSLFSLLFILSTICSMFMFEPNKNIYPGGLIGYWAKCILLAIFQYETALLFIFILCWSNLIILMQFNWLKYFNKLKKEKTGHVKEIVLQEDITDDITKDLFWDEYINDRKVEREIKIQNDFHDGKCPYTLPILNTIATHEKENSNQVEQENKLKANILQNKLEKFGIHGRVVNIINGSMVTLFEYEPSIDTKISNILSLEDDLTLALQALSLRIIAPIVGKSVVGFEVAKENPKPVYFSNILNQMSDTHSKIKLPLILGKDTLSNNIIIDLANLPHLLIGGSTGSGKSVGLNTMLNTLLCTKTPDQVKLILIDPKRLEFSTYSDIAHLLFEVITEPEKSISVLQWAVKTMDERYNTMALAGVKNKVEYSEIYTSDGIDPMPYIVIIIDELADLMMVVGKEIETLIARLAQMARAAGIHLIVATQRPSVDVVTGLIKVNFPCRISFKVTSKVDSRTILDRMGAQNLLGKGDMLYLDQKGGIQRIHGAYITDQEINNIVKQIKSQVVVEYEEIIQSSNQKSAIDKDVILDQVINFIKTKDEISISSIQRAFRIGYNRSARIIEQLETMGIIQQAMGSKMRKINKNIEGI